MDQKDEVKSKVDIVEVISSYIPLKKAGRNMSGLCPFHGEKTPSFMVSPERQAFKCFGCGESGDVFTFLEKMEGWDFKETLEELAKRVGVKLKKFAPGPESLKKDKIIEIHALCAKLYSHLLNKHPTGEKARKYLKGRGISDDTWNKFGLGYAPAGWENTFDFLKKRNFNISDVANSGLVIARSRTTQGSFYDRFRDRIVFPLKDIKGTVFGFSARIIEESKDRKEPKYINSPETPIFSKGSMLFGIDVAKGAIRDKNEVVLVEGEFDVLSSYAAGVENVVASKGTALTDKQIALISRFSESVVLCFDSDIAGDAAARRAIEMMDTVGMIVKVANLGEFKDPDEFIKGDKAGFKNAIKNASNIYDFLIDSVVSRYDTGSPTGKKKIGAEILPVLSKITDDMMRAHYIQKLARLLDLDINLIASAVSKKSPRIDIVEVEGEKENVTDKVSLEDYFLALVILHDELSPRIMGLLKATDFEEGNAKSLFSFLHDIMEASKRPKNPVKITKVLGKLPKALSEFVDDLYLIDLGADLEDREFRVKEIVKVAARISEKSLRRKLASVSGDLKLAEKEGNTKQLETLTKTFDLLSKKLGEVQHSLQVT